MSKVSVRRATVDDAEAVGELFDHYRQFYGRAPDRELAAEYLRSRLRRDESIVLVAESARDGFAGFCQMYPTFCSVEAAPILVLYDLFVRPSARRDGVARALMLAARDEALAAGVARMDLQTARTNGPARALYESLGWELDVTFDTYHQRY
jgi:ribosomal protein S18 acetylase RimI-like enzyme